MKSISNFLRFLISAVFISWLAGCGQDSKTPSQKTDAETPPPAKDENLTPSAKKAPLVASIPDAPEAPTPEGDWVGYNSQYDAIFEEDAAQDADGPLDHNRVFRRSDKAAYTGTITKLHLNGKVMYKGLYKDGYLEGTAKWWEPDGSLEDALQVKRGRSGNSLLDDLEGDARLAPTVSPPSAPTNGPSPSENIFIGTTNDLNTWTRTETINEESYLLDDRTGAKVTGSLTIYQNENGQLLESKPYKDGKLHGLWVTFYTNGNPNTESNYRDGIQHGASKVLFENGRVATETNYVDGELDGLETNYNEDGTISSQYLYKDGLKETIKE